MPTKTNRFAGIHRYLISFLILGGALVVMVLMTLLREDPADKENVSLLNTVVVWPAEDFRGKLDIDVTGIVEPHREVRVAAEVSGRVVHKSSRCQAGTLVSPDDKEPLLQINASDYELEKRRLTALLEQSKTSLDELDDDLAGLQSSLQLTEVDLELQQQEYERRLSLGTAASKTELDQARRSANAAERAVIELQNSIRTATTRRARLLSGIDLSQVQLDRANLDIERTSVGAPFDGVIVSEMVEAGDYVRAGDEVIVIEDTSKADVKSNLRLEQLRRIVKYQTPDSRFDLASNLAAYQLPPTAVTISWGEGDDRVEWPGTLVRFDGIGVDPQTKMIPCRIEVDDPVSVFRGKPRALVRGMFVKVNIQLDVAAADDETLLTIPAVALHPGNFVWSVVDGKLQRTKVEIIDRKNSSDPDPRKRMIVIRVKQGELKPDSQIVVSALAQPNPGVEVKPIPFDEENPEPATAEIPSDISPEPQTTRAGEPVDATSARVKQGVTRS